MDFAEFYRHVNGRDPFPWQCRLAAMVAGGDWPQALTLPTGCGKTSIVDIWAWAFSAGFAGVPRRLFYVVDRRIIVDAVTVHAERLARHVAGLLVTRLRGGLLPDETWVRDPTAPAIIASTVDQLGSRLLFRAYGVSHNVAPIHAGLAGNDALIVVDEAHLSSAFLNTLRAVNRYRRDKLGLPWRAMVMTATPAEGIETFALGEDDRRHPLLAKRINAKKPARLVDAPTGQFVDAVATHARRLREDGASVVGVIVNRVADARDVFTLLGKEGDAALLTGRVRALERDAILADVLPRTLSGACLQRPSLYVVATQTIEVGADLDFDGLVTEAAPLPELRQRFGRLNRLGERATTIATIVRRKSEGERGDPIYGDDLAATWKWLAEITQGRGKSKGVDFGLAAMEKACVLNPPPSRSIPPSPELLPAHIHALRHTSPSAKVDIAPFLHGWQTSADAMVVWRADLKVGDESNWPDIALAAPPLLGEMLSLPIYALRSWLLGAAADVADIEGIRVDGESRGQGKPVLLWDRERPWVAHAGGLRPGNIVFLPASYGGCDRYGWAPRSHSPVRDLGDIATEARARIRLHPVLYPEFADDIKRLLDDDAADPTEVLRALDAPASLLKSPRFVPYPGGLVAESGLWRVEPLGARRAVRLESHLAGVARWARRFGEACALPAEAIAAAEKAAAAHDLGKAEPAFQALLGGVPGNLLAKSARGRRIEMRAAMDAAGLPRGWRHEIASLVHAPDLTELERYLAGTHHGRGRALLPAAPDVALWERAGGAAWADLAAKLNEDWGPWALAYLETIVRLADWCRSEEEQRD